MDRESSLLQIPDPKDDRKDNRENRSTHIETDPKTISENIGDLCPDDTHEDDTYPVYRWAIEFFSYLYGQHNEKE